MVAVREETVDVASVDNKVGTAVVYNRGEGLVGASGDGVGANVDLIAS